MSDILLARITTDAESSEKESELSEIEYQEHISDESSSSSSSSTVYTTDDAETESDSSVISTLTQQSMPEIFTYKLVGDNIDKDVKPRQMRFDNQTRSLHYFHTYALKDRVDLSSLSDKPHPLPVDIKAIDLTELLPDKADDKCLQKNFAVLMARVICKYVPFFSRYGQAVERHIEHKYSHEMSLKSVVVSYYTTLFM